MEQLLHYCWKHRLFPPAPLRTADGKPIEVIDVGLCNNNDGPDFFNSKIRIDGLVQAGNVEIHDIASDWFRHNHDKDDKYNNVILHVCRVIDDEAKTKNGLFPPQLQLDIPQKVVENYENLLLTDRRPPCYQILSHLPSLTIHSWLNALQIERLEQKTSLINEINNRNSGDWELTYFTTLATNFGFGINSAAFEQWAKTVDLSAAAHHRDDPFQIEAIFMGQAGLLDAETIPERLREQTVSDDYFQRLANEYSYLRHKFGLKSMDRSWWRFMRLRPQNFPYIRLSQLVNLYCNRQKALSNICDCTTLDDVLQQLQTQVTPYWQSHYIFGSESKRINKQLSLASRRLIVINTVIPILFAYGRYKSDDRLIDRAFAFLEQIPAEDNHVIRAWSEAGLDVKTASDSQALIQLQKKYCDLRNCLRCRFGYEYLKIEI